MPRGEPSDRPIKMDREGRDVWAWIGSGTDEKRKEWKKGEEREMI